jgi:hypothetical protein
MLDFSDDNILQILAERGLKFQYESSLKPILEKIVANVFRIGYGLGFEDAMDQAAQDNAGESL